MSRRQRARLQQQRDLRARSIASAAAAFWAELSLRDAARGRSAHHRYAEPRGREFWAKWQRPSRRAPPVDLDVRIGRDVLSGDARTRLVSATQLGPRARPWPMSAARAQS